MKRKPIALLLASFITLGTLTSCDLNATLEKYLETLPPTYTEATATSPADPPAVTQGSDTLAAPDTNDIPADSDTATPEDDTASDTRPPEDTSLETHPTGDNPPESIPEETLPPETNPPETSTHTPVDLPMDYTTCPYALKQYTAGVFTTGSYDLFEAPGQKRLEWSSNAAPYLNTQDGTLEDWSRFLSSETYILTCANMVSAAGSDAPEDWQMKLCFLGDRSGLYIGLEVIDRNVVACFSPDTPTSGDAVHIGIDFGDILKNILNTDNDTYEIMTNAYYVTYTLPFNGDGGEAWLNVTNSDANRTIGREGGVIGQTYLTSNGWGAELLLPWEILAFDIIYKVYYEPTTFLIGRETPLQMGLGIGYRDMIATAGGSELRWVGVTHSGFAGISEDGTLLIPRENPPRIYWNPYDSGMSLYLPWQSDLDFNYKSIVVEK